jgi:MscS family membrane protein
LKAARKGDEEAAVQYLNTRSRGKAAANLAHQLFVVLDRRLPARLGELSDQPEGSLPFLTRPDEDLVGTINSNGGKVDILVEKVTRGKNSPVWLFSTKTLDNIPDLFAEIDAVSVENYLPRFLTQIRIAQIALYDWLAVFLGLPLLYTVTSLVSRGVSPWIGRARRHLRKNTELPDPVFLPKPVRLLLMALIIRGTVSKINLPLFARQFWSATAAMMTITAAVWLFILLNGRGEDMLTRRLDRINKSGAKSVLRLGRRTIDLLVIFFGMLVVFHYFGVNPTAALAGLGVGGIAVALAAQKTLENVIGGISIIFDQAVRVGDFLSTGSTMGVVEYVGLRSTRIRTLDRTVICLPNGQLANVQLENFSARDKFWFHPNLGVRYETTAETIRSIVANVSDLLARHSLVDGNSVRVRFLRFGTSSLDIEVVAYVFAHDWAHFLQIQQELLLHIMDIVATAGAHMAFPSQTMYLAADSVVGRDVIPAMLRHGRQEAQADSYNDLAPTRQGQGTIAR